MRTRLTPEKRKSALLEAALKLATEEGYHNLTRDGVAAAAGVSMGLVTHHYGTMTQLKRDVMRAAINRRVLSVVAEGVALRDKHALKAPEELRQAAYTAVQ